jgi:hypothetical protein
MKSSARYLDKGYIYILNDFGNKEGQSVGQTEGQTEERQQVL